MFELIIIEENEKLSLWGKIKTKIWNFILPPHIRLTIKK